MTTQTAVLAAPTGLTLTAKLFTLAAPDTTAFTADSVTERTDAKGQYVVSFGEASVISGDHTLILFLGTRPVAIGYRTFAGTDAEVATETPPTVELDSAARVKLATDQPDYAPATAATLAAVDAKIGTPETSLSAMVANVPTVTEFEARTIAAASYRQNISLRGSGMTEAKAFDLLLAASAGITSQPSDTTEKFKFLDGNDAFTTTFDTNGNRTGVALA